MDGNNAKQSEYKVVEVDCRVRLLPEFEQSMGGLLNADASMCSSAGFLVHQDVDNYRLGRGRPDAKI